MNIKDILTTMFGELRSANPKIPNEEFEKIWAQVEGKISEEPPPRIALIGETGVGKSSTLNALFNAGLEISHTEACTQVETEITITLNEVQGEKGVLIVNDMPGLSESQASTARHLKTYERVLRDVDVALWVLEANHRAIESVQDHLVNNIRSINPNLTDRIVFALNKVDQVHPGETAWHPLANLPSEEQEVNIKARVLDVERKIREALPAWRGMVIGYSAAKRYNLPQLFSVMLDAVPEKRQWVVASRKSIADFLELVDPHLLPPGVAPMSVSKKQKKEEEPSLEATLIALDGVSDEEFERISSDKGRFIEWLRANKKINLQGE